MRLHMFFYFSCYFGIHQGHSSSKQIEKEKKPRRKVIGLNIRFKWCVAQTQTSPGKPAQYSQGGGVGGAILYMIHRQLEEF